MTGCACEATSGFPLVTRHLSLITSLCPITFLEVGIMRAVVGVAILFGATLLVASGPRDTLAQGKKGSKGTIELIESKDGKFRFTVRDADGKYVGGSAVGHTTEKEAKEAAEELKKVMSTATYVSKKAETKDKDEKKTDKK